MPAPKGGKRPGGRKPPRPGGVRAARPERPNTPGDVAQAFEQGFPMHAPRPYRAIPEYRPESTAGLRNEISDLRAEVHRLAAEIDKLWARERGRGVATPGRTARSIAGKPVRTGTRASRPGPRTVAAGAPRSGPKRAAPSPKPKRSTAVKRGSGWAKPKSQSRRAGTTPRRKGR